MLKWFVCLVRRHQWYSWFDAERRRMRTACNRCSAEKTALFDTDINPNFF